MRYLQKSNGDQLADQEATTPYCKPHTSAVFACSNFQQQQDNRHEVGHVTHEPKDVHGVLLLCFLLSVDGYTYVVVYVRCLDVGQKTTQNHTIKFFA